MKVKNKIYALLAAPILALAFSACSNEVTEAAGTPESSSEGGNTAFIARLNGLRTAGTRSADLGLTGTLAGEAREKQLNKVYAVAFLNGKYYGTFEGTKPDDSDVGSDDQRYADDPTTTYAGTTDYRFDFKKIGSYKVYIVTNVDGTLNMTGTTEYEFSTSTGAVKTIANFTSGTSVPADFFAAIINQDPVGDLDSDGEADNFIMTSEEQTVNIDATKIKYQGEIEVTRAAARIDVVVENTMDANVGSETSDFQMTSVTFKNRHTNTLVARDGTTAKDMTITGLTKENKVYDLTTGVVAPAVGVKACEATLYGYENYSALDDVNPDPCTDGVTVINVKGVYKRGENEGLEVDYDIPFVDQSTGDAIEIDRNHLYKVTLKRMDNTPAVFDVMSYTIEVIDWATGETIKMTQASLKDVIVPTISEVSYGATPTVVVASGAGSDEYEIPHDATSVTIKTTTTSKAAAKLVTDNYRVLLYDENGVAIDGIEILEDTSKRIYHEDATLTQEFTVTFPANTSASDIEYQMHLENQFNAAYKTDFKIVHQVDPGI